MKISIILPVINETFSLKQTVDILVKENNNDLLEIIIVIAAITTQESLSVINELDRTYINLIKLHKQHLPFLGGALCEAFALAQGSHTILMASDLETDPTTVKNLILTAKQGYDIVCCTRWHKNANFKGYNPIKLILNKIFQIIFALMYRTDLTDMTFAFRIYKTKILKNIKWEELKHPFLFESIIKPLKLGYKAVEIPSSWQARSEGQSQNTFFKNFAYFSIGLKVLFTPKEKLIKNYE